MNKDSVGYALSLVGFCAYILYTITPTLLDKPLSVATTVSWQLLIIFVNSAISISMLYIGLISLSTSPLIKHKFKKKLLNPAPYYYELSYYIIAAAIPSALITYVIVKLTYDKSPILSIFLTLILLLLLINHLLKKSSIEYKKAALVAVIFGLIVTLSSGMISSEINVTMDKAYESNLGQIPISVEVTGLNKNLIVNLYEENQASYLVKTKDIVFDINKPRTKIETGNIEGFYLEDGVYNIYINATGMKPGVYGLTFNVGLANEYSTFYILNSNDNN
ncbi:hypothetical protein RE476_00065 [Methanolobus mangrovi]|uniref:Uncharacterized protein n=1 Tax=Methanolobus mangrovi TaxID=3072977 RepID=A0AA51UFY6_9EURY|nr:hypothetical protein [Methanolobus mangrovi]WMW22253.1 hypothetical protein RE476_00065 [Methanolobus mangrovi]